MGSNADFSYEDKWYKFWEDQGLFTPKIDRNKQPFSILLPLPNANDPIHIGHALFTVEDILVRYHRMLGEPTLWLPGADHAGIETQFVFEKKLAKEEKSRFDFDRETLYKMIEDFVEQNKNINRDQLKRLGFSLDWTRYHYSLEPKIISTVLDTFKKLHQDGLVYRGERIVNYCPRCGTSFSDLEVDYKEKEDKLYFLDYGPIQIATTRPETIFADVAIAVNPTDKRYQKLKNQKATIPLIDKEILVISDQAVDAKFGTGALKVTPAHDAIDFEIGQHHNLPVLTVVDKNGHMVNVPEKYLGLTINKAREEVVRDLELSGKLVKTQPLKHVVGVCYRCGATIEPMVMAQWFVKTQLLAKPAIEAVKKGKTKIVPKKRFEKMYFDWMNNIHDWNIGRQIVWGPRIPVWYCLDCNKDLTITFVNQSGQRISGYYQDLKKLYSFEEIKKGLQSLSAGKNPTYTLEERACPDCQGSAVLQETDTFDTWFLSGQWPLTTLGYPDSEDFKYFYPTSVLDTLWDILFFWVARMMMFGLYLTQDAPFKVIHLHSRVVDKLGQKMSKSKGNVINPIEMVDKFGADALRMSLVFGVAPGADIHLSEDKVVAMRNFVTKLRNIGRFIVDLKPENVKATDNLLKSGNTDDKIILKELDSTVKIVTDAIEKFRFNTAAEEIYEFIWHQFADIYIENSKQRRIEAQETLEYVFKTSLELLHPFMPFITEELWQKLPHQENSIMIAPWPRA